MPWRKRVILTLCIPFLTAILAALIFHYVFQYLWIDLDFLIEIFRSSFIFQLIFVFYYRIYE